MGKLASTRDITEQLGFSELSETMKALTALEFELNNVSYLMTDHKLFMKKPEGLNHYNNIIFEVMMKNIEIARESISNASLQSKLLLEDKSL